MKIKAKHLIITAIIIFILWKIRKNKQQSTPDQTSTDSSGSGSVTSIINDIVKGVTGEPVTVDPGTDAGSVVAPIEVDPEISTVTTEYKDQAPPRRISEILPTFSKASAHTTVAKDSKFLDNKTFSNSAFLMETK